MGDQDRPKLVKEVEPPQHRYSGVGVMLVASTAMFFAVAGSAFILRARMARESARMRGAAMPATRIAPQRAAPTPYAGEGSNCGQPVYRSNPDGSVSVLFELCGTPNDYPSSGYSTPGVVTTWDRIGAAE